MDPDGGSGALVWLALDPGWHLATACLQLANKLFLNTSNESVGRVAVRRLQSVRARGTSHFFFLFFGRNGLNQNFTIKIQSKSHPTIEPGIFCVHQLHQVGVHQEDIPLQSSWSPPTSSGDESGHDIIILNQTVPEAKNFRLFLYNNGMSKPSAARLLDILRRQEQVLHLYENRIAVGNGAVELKLGVPTIETRPHAASSPPPPVSQVPDRNRNHSPVASTPAPAPESSVTSAVAPTSSPLYSLASPSPRASPRADAARSSPSSSPSSSTQSRVHSSSTESTSPPSSHVYITPGAPPPQLPVPVPALPFLPSRSSHASHAAKPVLLPPLPYPAAQIDRAVLEADVLEQLLEMGFPEDYARQALMHTDVASPIALQRALNWMEENPMPDESVKDSHMHQMVDTLCGMGFDRYLLLN